MVVAGASMSAVMPSCAASAGLAPIRRSSLRTHPDPALTLSAAIINAVQPSSSRVDIGSDAQCFAYRGQVIIIDRIKDASSSVFSGLGRFMAYAPYCTGGNEGVKCKWEKINE